MIKKWKPEAYRKPLLARFPSVYRFVLRRGNKANQADCRTANVHSTLDLLVALAVFIVCRVTWENLPGEIVTMLLSKEQPPIALEGRGNLCAEETANAGISIGKMPAGDFVVALIVEGPGETQSGGAEERIECCGSVPALRENSDGLLRRRS